MRKRFDARGSAQDRKNKSKKDGDSRGEKKTFKKKPAPAQRAKKGTVQPEYSQKLKDTVSNPDEIRLNRYISNSGVCSRREADKLIESGEIKINGKVVTDLGTKVLKNDKVIYQDRVLDAEKKVYVLLNKPKDFITTTNDPDGRKTVLDLVSKAGDERIVPVGRLDRATTGLLLLTNDGDLAMKLTHPKNEISKVYEVTLDKPLTKADIKAIADTVELEDGPVPVADMVINTDDRRILGIEIHIGRNRIIRRLFEHLGYEVTKLDRVLFAGLTKKDLPRGKWRFLKESEVLALKNKKKL